MAGTRATLTGFLAFFIGLLIWCGSATAAGIRVVPSTQRALPGDSFYLDVVAEGIPAEGLGGVQFRLNVAVPGGSVTGVADLGQSRANEVAVATPLLVSPATATRSGIGDFFRNAAGPNGILVMDNEPLVNGSALYTFAHTSGATPPSGSGSVARFMVRVGSGVNAKEINIGLTDVMLLDGGPFYPLDYNSTATVQIGCFTKMPNLLGLSLSEAASRLAQSQLVLGNSYEIDNSGATRSLNVVLEQSSPAGSELLCESSVNLAVNVPPLEVTQATAIDKPGDDAGVVLLSWSPSLSGDVAGYRVYLGANLLKDVRNPAATGIEVGGLPNGVTSQLKVTTIDTFGNESHGVAIAATPLDDVAPVVVIGGVTEGAYYRTDVPLHVTISDTNLTSQIITLNGSPFVPAPVTAEGSYTLTATGTDYAGNQTTKAVHFTIDKTSPAISVTNVANNTSYKSAVTPAISITDNNLGESSVTLNGQPFMPGTPVSVAGGYELLVSATDLAGNSSSLAVAFVIDTVPPVLSVSTLSNGTYTNNETLNVAGVVRDDSALRDLQINGASVPVSVDGNFSYAYVLQNGVNTITITATDKAENRTTDTRTVTFDRTAPAMVISSPADNAKTGTPLLTVSGNVDEASAVIIKLGDIIQPAVQTGNTFSSDVILMPGYNTIEITATDLAGNKSTLKRTAIFDDQKPSLAITEPSQDMRTNQGSLAIRGTVTDPYTTVSVTITMGTQSFNPVVSNGHFEQLITFTTEMNNAIVVTATNEVGAATTVQRNIIYDITPPTVAIDPVTTPTSLSTQTVSGTREDGAVVTIVCATASVGPVDYPTATTWRAAVSEFSAIDNSITATATDASGNRSVVTANISYDIIPPAGTIVINNSSGFTASMQVSLSLSASDVSGISKMQFSNDGTSWSEPEPLISVKIWNVLPGDGLKQVLVRYQDNAGNWSVNPIAAAITLDTISPVITLSQSGGIYNTPQVVQVTPNESATIYCTVDGTTPGVNSASYSSPFTFSVNTVLKCLAIDRAGNMGSRTDNYIIDSVPPALSVSTLANGSYTNNIVLNLAGTISDNVGLKDIQINGIDVPVNVDGSFSHALQLVSGSNRIEVKASDLANNLVSDVRTIILDQKAPLLAISTPADNSKTGVASLEVTGYIDETSTVIVKVGEIVQSTVVNGSVFTSSVILVPGINTIEVTATDQANNPSTQKRTVVYDDQKPSLAITLPSLDLRTNLASILIQGTVSDPYTAVSVSISIDGQTFNPVVTDGRFEQAVSFNAEKSYAIVVIATNEVGSFTRSQRNIIYDTTPPSVSIDPVTSPTNQSTQTLSGTREAGTTVTLTCATATAGVVVYPSDTTWSATVNGFTVELNDIAVSAADAAGNVASATTRLVYDITQPTGTIAINNGAPFTNSLQVQLALSATDANGIAQMRFSTDGVSWTDPEPFAVTREWTLVSGDGPKQVNVQFRDTAVNWSQTVTSGISLDATPPAVSAVLPGGIYKAAQSVTLLANENATIYYTADGSMPTAGSSVFSQAISIPTSTTLKYFARDVAGNSSDVKTETYTIDTMLPVLNVSTLNDGDYTNNGTLNVAGTVTDNIGVQGLTVNGTSVPVNGDGSFSHAIVLQTGANVVTAVVNDLAGNQTTNSRTITLDQSAPDFTITAPADNSKTAGALAIVTGTVSETSTVQVKLGSTVHIAEMNGTNFTAGITLVPGSNTIEVIATDQANNTSSQKRTVVYDDQKPSLSITDPNQDIRTNKASLTINGMTADPFTSVTVAVTVDGQTFNPPVVNGAYEQTLTFTTEKNYAIVVTATNEVGSNTTVQRNVIYDITPPTLSIAPVTTPTNQISQTISGTREAGATVVVSCTTAVVSDVTYPTATSWSSMVSGFATDANDIVVTTSDAAWNSASATARIIYDTTPPTGTITINGGSVVTGLSQVQLQLSAADTNGVSQMRFSTDGSTWGDPEAYAATRVWFLAPGDGAKQVYVKYMDAAGNWSEVISTGIILDATPPITSTAPAGGIYRTGQSVTISANEPATIYYTTDGSIPTSAAPVYSHAISIAASTALKYYATDLAGNSSEVKTETYIVDSVPPVLNVSTLSDGAYTNHEALNIAGIVRDDTWIRELQVNKVTVPVNSEGSFSYVLLLKNGTNTVTTVATDLAENQTTDTRTINLDQTAPGLAVTAPADNSKTSHDLIAVTGTVDENSTVTITANDRDYVAAIYNGTFTATVTLVSGYNTINITAADLAGNQSSTKRTVIFDDQKPSLAVTDPTQDIRTNKANLTIRGAATDLYTSVTVAVTIDGQTFNPPVMNGAFEQTVTLTSEKSYAIVVTATNEVGSSTTVQRNVIYDITPPVLSIVPVISPTNQANQIVSGTREAGVDVTITCATAMVGAVSYPTPTTWQVGITDLSKGENVIKASSYDVTGNYVILSAKIVLEEKMPEVTITATPNVIWPPNHKMVPVTIGGSVVTHGTEIQSVSIIINDEYGKYNYNNLKFGSTVLLEAWRNGNNNDGRKYLITVVATDKAGNKTSKTTSVIVPHDEPQ